jgi:hypothetical protein
VGGGRSGGQVEEREGERERERKRASLVLVKEGGKRSIERTSVGRDSSLIDFEISRTFDTRAKKRQQILRTSD